MSALLESSAQINSILHPESKPEFMPYGAPVTHKKEVPRSKSFAPSGALKSELSLFAPSFAPPSRLELLVEQDSETERGNQ